MFQTHSKNMVDIKHEKYERLFSILTFKKPIVVDS